MPGTTTGACWRSSARTKKRLKCIKRPSARNFGTPVPSSGKKWSSVWTNWNRKRKKWNPIRENWNRKRKKWNPIRENWNRKMDSGYGRFGISHELVERAFRIEQALSGEFTRMHQIREANQLKVIAAMQKHRVS